MSIQASRADELMAEINITPFTDVLLVLLIIFMIIAAISTPPGFQKGFARGAGSSSLVAAARPIVVHIAANGRIRIDARPIDMQRIYPSMAQVVQGHLRDGSSTRVLLFADGNTRYDLIIKILDAARQAGDDDVGFVVQ